MTLLTEVFKIKEAGANVVRRDDLIKMLKWWEDKKSTGPFADTTEKQIIDWVSDYAYQAYGNLVHPETDIDNDQISPDRFEVEELKAIQYVAESILTDDTDSPVQTNKAKMLADWAKNATQGKTTELDRMG